MEFLEDAYTYSFDGIVDDIYFYSFISTGEHEIIKQVAFSPIDNLQTYNLGFGNIETEIDGTRRTNDKSDVNNNDFSKVLATVFKCLINFLSINNNAHVLFFGNTKHKHILYLRKISANIDELQKLFKIYGGTLKKQIELIETVDSNDRHIQEKDIDNRVFDESVVKDVEFFNSKRSKDYQFVLITSV
ncbi:MAG: hypothetical protein N4A45_12760 [Flavobacteriales bacterium]|jgi:hypothetical protein|nr:hypothetical protein [Flavobacteriales bacterium]